VAKSPLSRGSPTGVHRPNKSPGRGRLPQKKEDKSLLGRCLAIYGIPNGSKAATAGSRQPKSPKKQPPQSEAVPRRSPASAAAKPALSPPPIKKPPSPPPPEKRPAAQPSNAQPSNGQPSKSLLSRCLTAYNIPYSTSKRQPFSKRQPSPLKVVKFSQSRSRSRSRSPDRLVGITGRVCGCGNRLMPDSNFCRRCGVRALDLCRCGNTLDDANFCRKCGAPRSCTAGVNTDATMDRVGRWAGRSDETMLARAHEVRLRGAEEELRLITEAETAALGEAMLNAQGEEDER
jgi:hypothetical protein